MDLKRSVGNLQFNIGYNPVKAEPRPRVIKEEVVRLRDGRVVRMISLSNGQRRIVPLQ